jgi:Spy/CpxP family protein refolding chaperone
MNGITKTKAILYLTAIFVVGLLTGAVAGYTAGKRSFYRPPPHEKKMAADILERLRKELKLTDEQARKAEPLVNESSEQLRAIHEGAMGKVLEVMNQADRKLEELLTPKQKQKLAQMQKQREEWFRKGRPPHAHQKQ